MNWIHLTTTEQLADLEKASFREPQLIFIHSKKCPISKMVLERIEEMNATGWFAEVWQYREISNRIESIYGVRHQSPQVLIIQNGKAVYDEDHSKILPEKVAAQMKALETA